MELVEPQPLIADHASTIVRWIFAAHCIGALALSFLAGARWSQSRNRIAITLCGLELVYAVMELIGAMLMFSLMLRDPPLTVPDQHALNMWETHREQSRWAPVFAIGSAFIFVGCLAGSVVKPRPTLDSLLPEDPLYNVLILRDAGLLFTCLFWVACQFFHCMVVVSWIVPVLLIQHPTANVLGLVMRSIAVGMLIMRIGELFFSACIWRR